MISKKLGADLALVAVVFLATAGLVEAHRTYHGYIDPGLINFELRRQTLATRIANGVKEGQLNLADAGSLTADLNSITPPERGSTQEINALMHSRLDKQSSQIDLKMQDRKATSTRVDDLSAKEAQIKAQLSTSSLSPIQMAIFEKRLARIRAYETYLLAGDGLTYWQRKKINADLDLLSSRLSASLQSHKISLLKNQSCLF